MLRSHDRTVSPLTTAFTRFFFVSKKFDLLAVMFVLLTAFSFPFEYIVMYDKIKKPANYTNA